MHVYARENSERTLQSHTHTHRERGDIERGRREKKREKREGRERKRKKREGRE